MSEKSPIVEGAPTVEMSSPSTSYPKPGISMVPVERREVVEESVRRGRGGEGVWRRMGSGERSVMAGRRVGV